MAVLSLKSPREDEARRKASRQLVEQLVRELYQAETSAKKHCPREAERLGDAPAAVVLRTIADHARESLEELKAIARARKLPESQAGMTLGRLFSMARITVFDRMVPLHLAYRGTLLGVRHGLDIMTLLHAALPAAGLEDLAPWCKKWLVVRTPLVEEATRDVIWLAANPDVATRRPTLRESVLSNGRSTAKRRASAAAPGRQSHAPS